MNRSTILVLLLFLFVREIASGQDNTPDSFRWGNVTYLQLAVGQNIDFEGNEIELLEIKNHYNHIRINRDTFWVKFCYRCPAMETGKLKFFVAGSRNVKALTTDSGLHQLLKKDILLAVAPGGQPMLDPLRYLFPITFAGGYIWRNDEDSYPFSFQGGGSPRVVEDLQYPGIGLDVPNGRGSVRFSVIAMETGTVEWIDTKNENSSQPRASLCISSSSNPGIYYIYRGLYSREIFVKAGQTVEKGEELAFLWGDGLWEHLQLGIVYSDKTPVPAQWSVNMINFFPQLMELYYGKQPSGGQMFTKGQISFGAPTGSKGNVKNVSAYEFYQGTGWKLGMWNAADKVEWVANKTTGNARLSKTLFEGTPARCTNPENHYDFEIDVRSGIYRVRASIGDCYVQTWQKVEFENVTGGTYQINPGLFTWTPERIVRVKDGKLTVRIYLGESNQKAGIASIVFQQID
ncbi:MAG TPA: hypothetical protein PKJ24_08015 [Prolixibacteraceae bacterium]|nr:hypothetical protein [Prolixibacteraceae bacterium]